MAYQKIVAVLSTRSELTEEQTTEVMDIFDAYVNDFTKEQTDAITHLIAEDELHELHSVESQPSSTIQDDYEFIKTLEPLDAHLIYLTGKKREEYHSAATKVLSREYLLNCVTFSRPIYFYSNFIQNFCAFFRKIC